MSRPGCALTWLRLVWPGLVSACAGLLIGRAAYGLGFVLGVGYSKHEQYWARSGFGMGRRASSRQS